MRRTLWIGIATAWLLAGCGERAGPAAPPLPLDLPVVGTVGDPPSPAGRVEVVVTRDGWLRVPDRQEPLSLRDLGGWLVARSAAADTREPDGNSRLEAFLRIDRTTPWQVVQWLMQLCARPDVRIYRMAFEAEVPDGSRGAIVAQLPTDGSGPWPDDPRPPRIRVKAFQRGPDRTEGGLRALAAELAARLAAGGRHADTTCDIVAPPPHGGAVPYGRIVQVLDVCLASGVRFVLFEGAAMPGEGATWETAEGLRAHVQALRREEGVTVLRVGDRDAKDVPADPIGLGPAPGRGRVDGRWGSQPRPPLVFFEEPLFPDRAAGRGPFRGRGGGAGGDSEAPADDPAARAVAEALSWLATHQAGDGGWHAAAFHETCDGKPVPGSADRTDLGKPDYDVGVTGLALQAFLAAGYTNRGRHPFAKIVGRGLRYLKNHQDPEGCFGARTSPSYVYNHAMGAIAMLEAYGMTGSPIFKGSAQRALDFVAVARNPHGAWRYGVKPGDNDTSVTAWMAMALYVADRIDADAAARGKPAPLTIDAGAWPDAEAWLRSMVDPATGRAGYVQRGAGPARPQEMLGSFPSEASEAMTAAVCAVRLLHGADPAQDATLARGLDLVAALPPAWDGPPERRDLYAWQWGSLALARVGGPRWDAWRAGLATVVRSQRLDGEACGLKGSWDPVGPWQRDGGRVYSTAIVALALLAADRY